MCEYRFSSFVLFSSLRQLVSGAFIFILPIANRSDLSPQYAVFYAGFNSKMNYESFSKQYNYKTISISFGFLCDMFEARNGICTGSCVERLPEKPAAQKWARNISSDLRMPAFMAVGNIL